MSVFFFEGRGEEGIRKGTDTFRSTCSHGSSATNSSLCQRQEGTASAPRSTPRQSEPAYRQPLGRGVDVGVVLLVGEGNLHGLATVERLLLQSIKKRGGGERGCCLPKYHRARARLPKKVPGVCTPVAILPPCPCLDEHAVAVANEDARDVDAWLNKRAHAEVVMFAGSAVRNQGCQHPPALPLLPRQHTAQKERNMQHTNDTKQNPNPPPTPKTTRPSKQRISAGYPQSAPPAPSSLAAYR